MTATTPRGTAVVTGASSGIGAAIARELAARGHGVTLVARRAARLEELAAELAGTGVRAEVAPADLADPNDRRRLASDLGDGDLEVAGLVNNAGLSTTGAVHNGDVHDELRMVEVDVAAVVDLTTRLLPAMVERGRGAVLNVASTAAFQPLPGQAGYGASKAFVLSYTRALGGELRGTGVTATTLCPGPVHTEFGEVAGFTPDEVGMLPSFAWESPEAVASAGVEGMVRGHTVVVPGAANRVVAGLSRLTPKQVLVPLLARIHPSLRD